MTATEQRPATGPGAHLAPDVSIVEVSPRDGLQSEERILSTDDKVELVRRLVASGVRRIEAVSFVNPARVPQMADAAALMTAINAAGTLPDRSAVSIAGLVLNARGLDSAVECGVDEINVVVVCTDTLAQKNQGRTTAELIAVWHDVGTRAREYGLTTTVTLAAAFGCPYEGEVPTERRAEVLRRVLDVPPDEIAFADSIGVAVPPDVTRAVTDARSIDPAVALRCHFHNTRNTGVANVAAAVASGVTTFDTSLGGIGGCPFAPNATGNVATEDVLYMLHRSGHTTGIDLAALVSHVPWLSEIVGHPAPALVSRAGLFP